MASNEFMIDSNIFDELVKEPDEFIQALRNAVEGGLFRLFITYIQIAELQAIPGAERREQLRSILNAVSPEPVSAPGTYGVSRYDDPQSVYASTEQAVAHGEWTKGNHAAHGKDAVIAMVAQQRCFILVTENKKDMGAKAVRAGVEVWNYARFQQYVTSVV